MASRRVLVGGEQLVEIEVEALVLDGGADDVGVLSDEGDVQHGARKLPHAESGFKKSADVGHQVARAIDRKE